MSWTDFITGNDSGGENAATVSANTAEYGAGTAYDASNTGNNVLSGQLGNTNYYGNANEVYGQQQAAANMLQAQANGTAPSAAAIQQGVGQQAANAGLQSAALSQQGAMNPALAARNMLNSQAQAQMGIVSSGTAQRAQEQATAQGQYSSALANMQSQQQQQGQLQYQQGQNMLQTNTQLANNRYTNDMNTANTVLGNRMGNYHQQQQATSAGISAISGLAAAAAGAA